ncbi:MAG: hypothetical protein K8J09_19455 [Planctomycetes bacterium]|nr:hypothetical protein [Planctomycetota bacterium]
MFFDESGDFRETAPDPEERQSSRNRRHPSQLAGILAPHGSLTANAAAHLLTDLCNVVHRAFQGEFHATDLSGADVSAMVERALPSLAGQCWQPVRLTNREAVVFGDRVTTYANMVAELLLRCFQSLRRRGLVDVGIELHCAAVWDEGREDTFTSDDYLPRIREVLARAAIRAGHGENQQRWHLTGLHFRSGKRDPELQLCDLLSNASWANFRKLDAATKELLEQALGACDWTLQLRADLDRIEDLRAAGAFGLALLHTAECELATDRADRLRTDARRRRDAMVRNLADLGAPARDVHLHTILTELEQTIQWRRDLAPGRNLADWCLRSVATPLRQALPTAQQEEVDWFEFAVHLRLLMASNHDGDLGGSSAHLLPMQRLQRSIVKNWEHVDLFLEAQVHLAVHQTDARDFAGAVATAGQVADFHGNLASLFHAANPVLPEHVRSRRRGEALGTAMQAAMLAGLVEPSHFETARKLSDAAQAEFDSTADAKRQAQYRCQLETLAGALPAARSWLARAIVCAEDATAITLAITGLQSGGMERGFLLLHWLRFGAAAHGDPKAHAEAKAFTDSWQASPLGGDPWCTGQRTQHPGPSIQRYLGEIALANRDVAAAEQALLQLRRNCLAGVNTRPLLAMPLLALQSLSAVHAARHDRARLRNLLQDRNSVPGLTGLLDVLHAALHPWQGWRSILTAWTDACRALAQGSDHTESHHQLCRLAALVRF